MLTIEPHIVRPFSRNRYLIIKEGQVVSFKSISWNSKPMLVLLTLAGSLLIFLGTKDLSFALFGILMLLFPVLYDRWKFPEKLVFSPKEKSILIHKNWLTVKPVLYSDIQELYAEKNSLWSDVSAFNEGNRDHIYAFNILDKSGKKHRLLRLQFREEMDSDVIAIKHFLQALTA